MTILLFFSYITIGVLTCFTHNWMVQGTDDDAGLMAVVFWPLALPLILLELLWHCTVASHREMKLEQYLKFYYRRNRRYCPAIENTVGVKTVVKPTITNSYHSSSDIEEAMNEIEEYLGNKERTKDSYEVN